MRQSVAALDNQRVQILSGFPEDVHCQRVPLRGVLDHAQGVDGVIKHIVGVAQAVVGICNGNAQLREGLIGVACAGVGRRLHIVCELGQGSLERIHGYVQQFRGVRKFLQGPCAEAGLGG